MHLALFLRINSNIPEGVSPPRKPFRILSLVLGHARRNRLSAGQGSVSSLNQLPVVPDTVPECGALHRGAEDGGK
jgi:hypothetical protein